METEVKFTVTIINVENNYNEATGVFVALIPRVYTFVVKGKLLIHPKHSLKSGTLVLQIDLIFLSRSNVVMAGSVKGCMFLPHNITIISCMMHIDGMMW